MEIACRNNHVLIREHGRVVRHTVDFHFYDSLHVFDRVLRGSVYLRYATEGIRVLHVFLRSAYYLAAFQQFKYIFGCADLTFVRPYAMRLRIEGLDAAVVGVDRHCCNPVRPSGQSLRLEQRPDSVRAHELGAVKQCKSLL